MRYSITENKLIDTILNRLPRGEGTMPKEEISKMPEFQTLAKTRQPATIFQQLTKVWRKSVMKVEPEKKDVKLNHAYNFCPGCGMKLN